MKKKIYIRGMHCVACEKIIEDELMHVPFVKEVKADRKKGELEIRYGEKEPNTLAIQEMVKKIGYEAQESPFDLEKKTTVEKILQNLNAIIIAIFLVVIYRIFQNFGILDRINIQSTEITYAVAFLVGLVASVSTCLAVVGGVVIAFSEKYKSEGRGFYENAVRPNVMFHAGRLVTFFVLGGLLGFIGGEINISGNFVAIFTIIVAIVMGILGLNILGIIPSISEFGIRMPKGITKKWSAFKNSEHRMTPLFLGGLTFFLPCGFTQSMQIFALTSGSFFMGGAILFLFALGTVPALLILGITTSWAKGKGIAVFQKVAGIIIILFAIYTLNSGLALRGANNNIFQKQNPIQTEVEENNNSNEQIIRMKITSQGFAPSTLKIKKDIPVKWIIDGNQVSSCTNKIIIPSLDISKNISKGENVINFTPKKTGEIPFSCWMGMVRGKFIVE
ncbi:MAG: sulfite exporter TauE/SafE family protein [Candidatus Moraniibacteriota bacterium]